MRYYGKRRNYRKKPATKKRVYKKRAPVSSAVKQYVSRSIKVASENKIVNWNYFGDLYNFNASASQWYTYNFHQISPNSTNLAIAQSVAQNGRVGNQVKTVRGMLKFIISPLPYSAVSNATLYPSNIRIVIFSSKPHPVQLPPFTNFQNHLFQNGSTSQGPVSNSLLDQLSDINKDMFTVYYDKSVKLGYAGINGGAGSGGSAGTQYFVNNDFKLNIMRKINVTKYLQRLYTYNDNTNNPTSGRSLYIMFLQNNADGTAQVGSQIQNKISMSMDYNFEE